MAKPKVNLHFLLDDMNLLNFLETSFQTMTQGIIESIQLNFEKYNNIENPHQHDLLSASPQLKKKLVQNMSAKDYQTLGFMLAELNGIYNKPEIIDIMHKKRESEAIPN